MSNNDVHSMLVIFINETIDEEIFFNQITREHIVTILMKEREEVIT